MDRTFRTPTHWLELYTWSPLGAPRQSPIIGSRSATFPTLLLPPASRAAGCWTNRPSPPARDADRYFTHWSTGWIAPALYQLGWRLSATLSDFHCQLSRRFRANRGRTGKTYSLWRPWCGEQHRQQQHQSTTSSFRGGPPGGWSIVLSSATLSLESCRFLSHFYIYLTLGEDHPWYRPMAWISQLEQDTGINSTDQLWNFAADRTEWEALRRWAGSTDQWWWTLYPYFITMPFWRIKIFTSYVQFCQIVTSVHHTSLFLAMWTAISSSRFS